MPEMTCETIGDGYFSYDWTCDNPDEGDKRKELTIHIPDTQTADLFFADLAKLENGQVYKALSWVRRDDGRGRTMVPSVASRTFMSQDALNDALNDAWKDASERAEKDALKEALLNDALKEAERAEKDACSDVSCGP